MVGDYNDSGSFTTANFARGASNNSDVAYTATINTGKGVSKKRKKN